MLKLLADVHSSAKLHTSTPALGILVRTNHEPAAMKLDNDTAQAHIPPKLSSVFTNVLQIEDLQASKHCLVDEGLMGKQQTEYLQRQLEGCQQELRRMQVHISSFLPTYLPFFLPSLLSIFLPSSPILRPDHCPVSAFFCDSYH